MRKIHKTIFMAGPVVLGVAISTSASAQCQICTLVVGAGVGLSRWLGIDDTVSGVWVGGLIMSLVFGSVSWIDRSGFGFKGNAIVTAMVLYLSVLGPRHFLGIIGQCANKLWGIDKLLMGVATGSALFYLGARWYQRIKLRKGHGYFPFQKVVMPVLPLIVASVAFCCLVK